MPLVIVVIGASAPVISCITGCARDVAEVRVAELARRPHALELPRRDEALAHQARVVELHETAPDRTVRLEEVERDACQFERGIEATGQRP